MKDNQVKAIITAMKACTQAIILTKSSEFDEEDPIFKSIISESVQLEEDIDDALSYLE